jgi:hypothetical protein
VFAKAAGVIGATFIFGCQILLVSSFIIRVIERRALRRGTVAAFRRGAIIASDRGHFRASTVREIPSLETLHGLGQWLANDAFAFWARENYGARGQCLAWVGLCTVAGEEAVFEVRLLRSSALHVAAIFVWLLAMVIAGAIVGYLFAGYMFVALALGVGAGDFLLARAFRRERAFAEEVMQEFRERFGRS